MSRRPGIAALVAVAALLLAGCASAPGTGPTSSPGPDGTESPGTQPPAELEVEGAWLDDGRMIGVVTWGSSSCVPVQDEVSADGQRVTVTLAYPEPDAVCTADYSPRATPVALPEGVDPAADVEVTVEIDGATGRFGLDGDDDLRGSGQETDYQPSAGWFDDHGLVLLTWGSSTCPPRIAEVAESDDAATVAFLDEDRACTFDMVPRLTLLVLEQDHDDLVLTLTGGGFDGQQVHVRGD